MPNLSSETIQQTIYEGPISMAQAIYIGIALLLLFTVTLYIEKKHSGRNIVALFWVLRLGALAGLLWMLLGPSEQTVTKFKTLKSIAVVADVSQSMQTVDALDATGDQRWQLTQQTELNNSELVSLDHLHLNISQLKRHYLSLMEMLEQAENSQAMLEKLHRIQKITTRALSHATSLENQLNLSGKADFTDMSTELENDLLAEFNQLEDELSDSEEIINLNRFNQLAKLEPLLEKHLQQTRFHLRNNLTETENTHTELANHSRLDKVRSSLVNAEESWLKQLSEQVKVKRYTFDSNIYALKKGQWDLATDTNTKPGSTSLDDQEQLASTDMTAVLDLINEEAAKDSVEAVILLTDGKQTTIGGRSMSQAASALGSLPVYPVPIGSSKRLRDVVLHYPNAPAAVMKDDTISIETMIDTFDCEGEILSVQLKKDNIVLDQQSIDVLSARSHHRVTFVAPEQDYGRHEFQVEVLPVADEERINNNSAQVTVDVVVDEFHILLADETWRWEYRYLVNLFERDPKITFDHLVHQPNLIATGKLKNRRSLPETVEEWSQYRVIVLGDLSPQNFSLAAQNSLKEYITRRGGNLILIAGTENMPSRYLNGPLVDLLPIEPSPVSVDNQQGYFWQLTGEGRTSTATQLLADQSASERVWQTASMTMPVYTLSQFCEPKSTTHTLISAVSKRNRSSNPAEGDQLPAFLCWHFAGKGSI